MSLEHLGRKWAKDYEEIYITSGAVFDYNARDARDKDEKAARMGSRNEKGRVAIPSDYYKIFLRQVNGTWHAISFLLEHNNNINGSNWVDVFGPVNAAITPLEDIEVVSETSFFPDIDRNELVQNDLSAWNLTQSASSFEASCK